MKKIIAFAFLILSFSCLYTENTSALKSDDSCTDVDIIFARGSGQNLNAKEQGQLRDQLNIRFGVKVSAHFYELGTETYSGAKYPAVDAGVFNGNAIGAVISAGKSNDYGRSVSLGRTELEGYIAKRSEKCPNERIVLGGYSQGAQVMGDAHTRLSAYANRIDFIALFGDPKLHLPEGEGIYPDACRGVNLSTYRRDIGDCHADNGALGARKPYLTSQFSNKTGLWCKAKDFICGTSKLVYDQAGHEKYAEPGGPIDKAAKEIAEKLKKSLASNKGETINTAHIQAGTGTTGLDVVFVIDTTGSMGDRIEQTKQFARSQAAKIKELRGRVALVAYKDVEEGGARIISGLSEDQANFRSGLDALQASGGGDIPEAGLYGLMTAFNGLSWKDGATKAAVMLTDAPFHNPDKVDGSTIDSVAKRSLEIDPVNVYPVVPNGLQDYYTELASKTSGEVIIDNGDTEEALTKALTKIEQRPTVLLKNTTYTANPGQEVTFDASDSYVIDATITKYEWDFDGNGTFDTQTVTPVVNHTYAQKFDGVMQVRLTASNNTIANGSAFVKIGTYVQPVRPKVPTNVTATVLSTASSVSTVKLSWKAADGLADKWAISVNGIKLGLAAGNKTAIEIADIQRSEDATLGVAGVTADGTIGEEGVVIVTKAASTSPSVPPQSWWEEILERQRQLYNPFTQR